MEKKIIALRGQPNSGKTGAIHLAYRELETRGSREYSNPRYDATELKAILVIGGVRIGFASAGDTPNRLGRTLQFLHERGCFVIVCAARLNRFGEPLHKTVAVVETFCEANGFGLEWIEKQRNRDGIDKANRAVADDIVARVLAAIGSVEPLRT